jgi:hypothetical protein
MTDYRQVVDEIRSHLQGMDQTLSDRLKELAAAYGRVCEACNQRLRRCEEYLSRGLRSEAIQYAQAEPTLLDVVAALEFPERAKFEELLLFYHLPAPPRLQTATAEALNKAYAEEQPLESRLQEHRRLALSRAPLVERLQVMREVAMLDVNNPMWLEDVREFETARVREIEAALQAGERPSVERVEALSAEIEQGVWFNRPPERVVRRVRELKQQRTRDELEVVVEKLHGAMARQDYAGAQPLRDVYQSLTRRVALAPEDPLLRRARRPLNWLLEVEREQSDELEYQTAVAAVEEALDAKAGPEVVTELYHKAAGRKMKMPTALKKRYEEYQAEAYRSRRWREGMTLLLVAIFGLAGLLLLLAFLRLR